MEVRSPQRIVYETDEIVPVEDIIQSLQGMSELAQEIGPVLELFLDGVFVNEVRLSVIEISQRSPLTELLAATVAIALQKDLEKEIPSIVDAVTGSHLGHDYPAIITLVFCVLLIYSVKCAADRLKIVGENSHSKGKLDEIIIGLAKECHLPEDTVRKRLTERYTGRKLKGLVYSSLKVFRPSKNKNNAAIRIEPILFDRKLVAEVPSDAQMLDFDPEPSSRSMENVTVELRAQDLDRSKTGWAGVIPQISEKRMKMELYPTVNPDDVYTRSTVIGDVILMYKTELSGERVPYMFHLIKVHKGPS